MIPKEWLEKEPERVRLAARDVLYRMSGCTDSDCFSCRHNRENVEALIAAVRDVEERVAEIRADLNGVRA